VEAVHLPQIDVIGTETLQARLASADQMVTRGADVVGTGTGAEGRLGRDQNLVAPSRDGLAENLLGQTVRIGIRRVEQREARVEAEIDEARRLARSARAPGAKEVVAAAEGRRPEAELGNFET